MKIEESDHVLNVILSEDDYQQLRWDAGSVGVEVWLSKALAAGIALEELAVAGAELLPGYDGPLSMATRVQTLRNFIVLDPTNG